MGRDGDNLFLIFNAGDSPQAFELPPNDNGEPWDLALTTQDKTPAVRTKGRPVVTVDGQSVTVFTTR